MNKKTSKILYVCIGTLGVGELENAVAFMDSLKPHGIDGHFLVLPFGKSFIEKAGLPYTACGFRMKENKQIFDAVCKKYQPDLILIADVAIEFFHYGSKHLFDIQWVMDNPVNAPFATFDYFGLSCQTKQFVTCQSDKVEDKVRYIRTTDITDKMPVFRPCPFSYPNDFQRNVFYYRRPIKESVWEDDKKNFYKQVYGLKKGEKLIVLSFAKWAFQAAMGVNGNFAQWLHHYSRYLSKIFSCIKGNATIVVVSAYPLKFDGLPSLIKVINFDYLPVDKYSTYMGMCDLYLSSNAFANSLLQSSMSGTPAAALICSGTKPSFFSTPLSFRKWFKIASAQFPSLIQKYYLFPLGWAEIVEPLIENNPLFDTFRVLDIMYPRSVIKSINDLLFNRSVIEDLKKQQNDYKNIIESIPNSIQLLNEVYPIETTQKISS